jgi:hypothetical protein
VTKKTEGELAMAASKRRAPVRVKLQRINANLSRGYPPDGEGKIWWAHLKRALGTASSDFVNASLLELQVAAQLPFGGISEVGMNAALALIEGVAPRNEIEGAIAVQMPAPMRRPCPSWQDSEVVVEPRRLPLRRLGC